MVGGTPERRLTTGETSSAVQQALTVGTDVQGGVIQAHGSVGATKLLALVPVFLGFVIS